MNCTTSWRVWDALGKSFFGSQLRDPIPPRGRVGMEAQIGAGSTEEAQSLLPVNNEQNLMRYPAEIETPMRLG